MKNVLNKNSSNSIDTTVNINNSNNKKNNTSNSISSKSEISVRLSNSPLHPPLRFSENSCNKIISDQVQRIGSSKHVRIVKKFVDQNISVDNNLGSHRSKITNTAQKLDKMSPFKEDNPKINISSSSFNTKKSPLNHRQNKVSIDLTPNNSNKNDKDVSIRSSSINSARKILQNSKSIILSKKMKEEDSNIKNFLNIVGKQIYDDHRELMSDEESLEFSNAIYASSELSNLVPLNNIKNNINNNNNNFYQNNNAPVTQINKSLNLINTLQGSSIPSPTLKRRKLGFKTQNHGKQDQGVMSKLNKFGLLDKLIASRRDELFGGNSKELLEINNYCKDQQNSRVRGKSSYNSQFKYYIPNSASNEPNPGLAQTSQFNLSPNANRRGGRKFSTEHSIQYVEKFNDKLFLSNTRKNKNDTLIERAGSKDTDSSNQIGGIISKKTLNGSNINSYRNDNKNGFVNALAVSSNSNPLSNYANRGNLEESSNSMVGLIGDSHLNNSNDLTGNAGVNQNNSLNNSKIYSHINPVNTISFVGSKSNSAANSNIQSPQKNRISILDGMSFFIKNEQIAEGLFQGDISIQKTKSKQFDSQKTKSNLNQEILTNRSVKEYKNVYDSVGDDEEEDNIDFLLEDYENDKYVFTLDSYFRNFWSNLVFFLILYSVTVSPYILAFYDQENGPILYFDIVVDILFIVDIFINFFTPFYDDDDNLMANHKKIMWNYFTGWFFLDIISSFPVGIINYATVQEEITDPGFAKFKSIIRISRIYRLSKWLKIFRLLKLSKNTSKKATEIFSSIKFVYSLEMNRIVNFVGLFFLLIHVSTCLWIYIAKIDDGVSNWIFTRKYLDYDDISLYVVSLYFQLSTIFTIGYGDITSNTLGERIYNIVFMIVGIIMYSFGLSSLSSIFSKLDDKAVRLQKKFRILTDIQHEFKIPKQLLQKLKKTINHEIKKTNIERYEFIESLPPIIRNEIILIIHKHHIKQLHFFKEQNHDFILFVLPLLKPLALAKGETLFSIGEFVEEMYLVTKGNLSLNLGPLYDFMEVAQIPEDHHIGDILLYLHEQSPYDLKARQSQVEVLVIKKNDFIKIKTQFNQNILHILQNSLKRMELYERRRFIIVQIHKYENNPKLIYSKMRRLNMLLMNKDFDEYFNSDGDIQELNEFLETVDEEDFIKIIQFNPEAMEYQINEWKMQNGQINNNVKDENQEKENLYFQDNETGDETTKNSGLPNQMFKPMTLGPQINNIGHSDGTIINGSFVKSNSLYINKTKKPSDLDNSIYIQDIPKIEKDALNKNLLKGLNIQKKKTLAWAEDNTTYKYTDSVKYQSKKSSGRLIEDSKDDSNLHESIISDLNLNKSLSYFDDNTSSIVGSKFSSTILVNGASKTISNNQSAHPSAESPDKRASAHDLRNKKIKLMKSESHNKNSSTYTPTSKKQKSIKKLVNEILFLNRIKSGIESGGNNMGNSPISKDSDNNQKKNSDISIINYEQNDTNQNYKNKSRDSHHHLTEYHINNHHKNHNNLQKPLEDYKRKMSIAVGGLNLGVIKDELSFNEKAGNLLQGESAQLQKIKNSIAVLSKRRKSVSVNNNYMYNQKNKIKILDETGSPTKNNKNSSKKLSANYSNKGNSPYNNKDVNSSFDNINVFTHSDDKQSVSSKCSKEKFFTTNNDKTFEFQNSSRKYQSTTSHLPEKNLSKRNDHSPINTYKEEKTERKEKNIFNINLSQITDRNSLPKINVNYSNPIVINDYESDGLNLDNITIKNSDSNSQLITVNKDDSPNKNHISINVYNYETNINKNYIIMDNQGRTLDNNNNNLSTSYKDNKIKNSNNFSEDLNGFSKQKSNPNSLGLSESINKLIHLNNNLSPKKTLTLFNIVPNNNLGDPNSIRNSSNSNRGSKNIGNINHMINNTIDEVDESFIGDNNSNRRNSNIKANRNSKVPFGTQIHSTNKNLLDKDNNLSFADTFKLAATKEKNVSRTNLGFKNLNILKTRTSDIDINGRSDKKKSTVLERFNEKIHNDDETIYNKSDLLSFNLRNMIDTHGEEKELLKNYKKIDRLLYLVKLLKK